MNGGNVFRSTVGHEIVSGVCFPQIMFTSVFVAHLILSRVCVCVDTELDYESCSCQSGPGLSLGVGQSPSSDSGSGPNLDPDPGLGLEATRWRTCSACVYRLRSSLSDADIMIVRT